MLNADTTEALFDLQLEGRRTSKIRMALLALFEEHREPLSFENLQSLLKDQDLAPHRATLYRELDFLKEQKLLVTIMLPSGKLRYELAAGTHHHHLMCMKCQKIEDIELDDQFADYEREIAEKKRFKVLQHSLEFLGLCVNCK